MKGYWHLPAFAILGSALTIIFQSYIFILFYGLWVAYLFIKKRIQAFHLFLSLVFLLVFLFHMPQIKIPEESHWLLQAEQYTGVIDSPPIFTDDYMRITIKENHSKEKINIHYFLNGEKDDIDLSTIKYGATCQVNNSVELPSSSSNPGQFNYQKYLLQQGISFETILSSIEDISCQGKHPLDIVYSFRNYLLQYTSELLSYDTASWLQALVLGSDAHLPKDVIELFNRWSLSHILAISGLHVGLVTGILYMGLVKLNITTKETAQWLIIFFLPIYALLAGGAPSVWRASLMGLVFLVLSKFNIKHSVTDVISLIFISLIAMDPYIIYHIGFQFSFLVTFGLLLSRDWLLHTSSPFWQLLKISFISQMVITPLQIYYFYYFQPLSIIVNSLIVPYFSLFVIPAMFLLLILSPLLPKFALIFDKFFTFIHDIILSMIYGIDYLFDYAWIIGKISLVTIVVYYIALNMMMAYLENRRFNRAFYVSLFIVGLFVFISLQPYLSEKGRVTMLDIGQGDAFVIELPYRKGVILIDAGASFSFKDFKPSERVYSQIIQPYFYYRGITDIDAIIVSHEDIDHNGSIPFIVEDFNVEKLVVSEPYELNKSEKELIKEGKISIKRVSYDEQFLIGNHIFHVLSPEKEFHDENDNSLVVYTSLGKLDWLFTGDISKNVERQILAKSRELEVDVLKVAHHGSKTSTDKNFVDQINPKYAFISVGRNNSYGHPSKEVLKALKKSIILRTDKDGAVQYNFYGDQYDIERFLQKNKETEFSLFNMYHY
ncbi:MAG TPA: DNA internalization-related competence protein ComEC/Rec2 [Bacillota bacterium]|nr:DNA internalization-related competence protein ComEC/Rec2 [Bacillota bacterium]